MITICVYLKDSYDLVKNILNGFDMNLVLGILVILLRSKTTILSMRILS